jgi:hypothetical protein
VHLVSCHHDLRRPLVFTFSRLIVAGDVWQGSASRTTSVVELVYTIGGIVFYPSATERAQFLAVRSGASDRATEPHTACKWHSATTKSSLEIP